MSLQRAMKILDRVQREAERFPRRAAAVALEFTDKRFREKNWIDKSTKPWKRRKPVKGESRKRSGRGILVDSGRLKNSPRTISVTSKSATIGTDVPYAQVHNEGYKGTVNVPSHTRGPVRVRSHRRDGKRIKAHTRDAHQVQSFSRKMNMPQRQFMGESDALNKQIERRLTAELIKAFKV
jgi:phage gpG-like protein